MGASFRSGKGVVLGVALAGAASIVGALVGAACIPELQITELPPPPPPPTCGNGFVDLDAGEQCDPGEAGAVGCSASCRVECGEGGLVDETSGHCYFTPTALPASFTSAGAVCVLATAHLLTFVSRDEVATVAGWAGRTADAAAWIGLQNAPNAGWVPAANIDEPGWTTACAGCYAGHDDAGSFPQPEDASSPCLVVPAGAEPELWQRVPCNQREVHRTVCEREPPGVLSQACNGGICIDLRHTFGRKRYIYIATKTSSDDATAFCQQFPSGRLVMPDTREEREEMWAELAKIDDDLTQIWVGLHRVEGDGGPASWQWDDGASLDAGRPVPWGVAAVALDAGSSRAYLERLAGAGVVDSQLARNLDRFGAPLPTELPFVCQFVDVPDAGDQ